MNYKSGEEPRVGDNIVHTNDTGEDNCYSVTVFSINDDGTLNLDEGMGIIPECLPEDYILVENDWKSFWEALSNSKEEDILECEWEMTQRIVNNGDYTFMWEESWERVELSGEFIGAKWRKVKR